MAAGKIGRVPQQQTPIKVSYLAMAEYFSESGLYWRPLGGNNIDQISGHCYQYTDIKSLKSGLKATTIVVDLGKFDNHQALGIKNSVAAVPDIRELLKTPFLEPEAIFLTHSHPDHLNGIVHYLKAGYALPPLYGGKYTMMILNELYDEFCVMPYERPDFNIIDDGDVIKCGSFKIEVLASSHTCFDSFGLLITAHDGTTVYHTGDMKTDNSTYFRKPTNLKRLAQMSGKVDFTVCDFCGIVRDGLAVREVDTFKKLVQIIKKSRKNKIFIPVYPTHAEMYLIAFLAALKQKKDVIFYGGKDFYSYLEQIKNYGLDFEKLAGNRIKVYVGTPPEIKKLKGKFAVIGTYNDIGNHFNESSSDSLGIITSGTFFNPLRGQFNARNVRFVDTKDYPVLQGYGHGFLGDYEKINQILAKPVFIPTHCPIYVIDSCRKLAEYIGIKIATPTAQNNHTYKLGKDGFKEVKASPATWLVVSYANNQAAFTEVWQKPTSGMGFLKRTFSARRCRNQFEMMLHQRQNKDNRNADK